MKLSTLHAGFMAATAFVGLSFATDAKAQTVAALVGDNIIAIVDAGTKKVTRTVKVSGADGNVIGIDVRPADGMLYALMTDGTIATVDVATGKATLKSKLDMALPTSGSMTVDFNPAADRLRVIGADGTNLRINVDDGKVTKDGNLKFGEGAMSSMKANIVAGAYTNSVKGTKETALYDIDAGSGSLVLQAPPNDGILTSVGKLGITGNAMSFDIASDGKGGNNAFLMADDILHQIDLMTGKATVISKIQGITGAVRDIAVLPAM
jgi:DNA-binding beta-propeller fold protein YncE